MKIVERHGSVLRSDTAACAEPGCAWQARGSGAVVDDARRHAAGGHPVRLTRTRSVILVDLARETPT
jgi:hypothetical protein